jgi:hypothetical protein
VVTDITARSQVLETGEQLLPARGVAQAVGNAMRERSDPHRTSMVGDGGASEASLDIVLVYPRYRAALDRARPRVPLE